MQGFYLDFPKDKPIVNCSEIYLFIEFVSDSGNNLRTVNKTSIPFSFIQTPDVNKYKECEFKLHKNKLYKEFMAPLANEFPTYQQQYKTSPVSLYKVVFNIQTPKENQVYNVSMFYERNYLTSKLDIPYSYMITMASSQFNEGLC